MKEEDLRTCFYCDAIVRKPLLAFGDHFPVPTACGGEITVDCCQSCHDMKDRYYLNDWPVEWAMKVIEDFPKFTRETRLFLAKAMRLMFNASERIKTDLIIMHWKEGNPVEKIAQAVNLPESEVLRIAGKHGLVKTDS